MLIRPAALIDAESIRTLNINTIRFVNAKDYTVNQIKVWSSFDNLDNWKKLIFIQKFWVVEIGHEIVGFGSLTINGLFDFLYVHHNYQRIGVASLLQDEVEKEARLQGNSKVFASVSITAQPFFLSKGYSILKMERNEVKREVFVNALLEKFLF